MNGDVLLLGTTMACWACFLKLFGLKLLDSERLAVMPSLLGKFLRLLFRVHIFTRELKPKVFM
jgi:hypothetical protein